MPILSFAATEVDRIISHAQRCERFLQVHDTATTKPMVVLVGDQGVYLMSNGLPGDMHQPPSTWFVAYAQGMNPGLDADWWDTKRAVYGGDDGADALDLVDALRALLDRGDAQIHLRLSDTSIHLIDLQPGDICQTPSSLDGVFRVRVLSIGDGKARVQNTGNASDFDDAAPYYVSLDRLRRLDRRAAPVRGAA